MEHKKEIYTRWIPSQSLLVTRLSGLVDERDVQLWTSGLFAELDRLPPVSDFKLFSDLHGFKAVNMEAHKMMRTVIPRLMLDHGMMPAYAKLFPETTVEPLQNSRRCIACVHVHHDESKITRYHNELATASEEFFTSREAALAWLEQHKIYNNN